jgi:serine/threonine protein kinase/Tfp pilus assembly protein PilF
VIGKTISHYKILEKLGEGGMGVVYKAEDTKLKRTVALKFLPFHLTKEKTDLARFLQEAQAAAALNHPNVCTIHEINDEGENPFIVMEYVDGETLREKLHAKRIEVKDTIEYAIQIAESLKVAHSIGIIHRDIKSDNIMVMDDGRVKVMDFGLAKLRGSIQITKSTSTVGTLAYMAPEHLQGQEADARTDIFSFGVVLYEMLTGQLPFKGEYESAIMYAIINEEPKPVTHMQTGTPPEINVIVNRSLSKNVNERYQNMEELLEDLAKFEREFKSGQLSGARSDKKSFPSIAVLPFVNMSADPEQEYFCDGMSEEIINALTHIEDLHVVARTSAFKFKGKNVNIFEIAKELHVDNILEGSVRKAGNRLRITAQLIKVANGYHLWSEKYDRNMEDIFDIQDEISLAIIESLKVKLLGEEKVKIVKRHTEDLDAYNLYLKGRFYSDMLTPAGFKQAVECFEKALLKDSNYAKAYVGLGIVYRFIALFGNVSPNDLVPKIRVNAEKALEIDNALGEAHCLLATCYMSYDWDWPRVEEELKLALNMNPNSSVVHFYYSVFYTFTERHDRAVAAAKRARELDPLSILINFIVGHSLYFAGRYDESIKDLEVTLTMSPNYYPLHYTLAYNYRKKSMFKEALEEIKKANEISNGIPFTVFLLALSLYEMGNTDRAKELLESLEQKAKREYVPPVLLYLLNRTFDDSEKASVWLEKAYEEHDSFLGWCRVSPDDSIRLPPDPRLTEKLKGLTK